MINWRVMSKSFVTLGATDGGMFAPDRIAQQFPLLLFERDFKPGDAKLRLPPMHSG